MTDELIPHCTGVGVSLRDGAQRFVLQFDTPQAMAAYLETYPCVGLPVWCEVSDTRKEPRTCAK